MTNGFKSGWRRLIGDVDSNVRYQLAFSLGALSGSRPVDALAALALRDGADSWMRMAILSSASACMGELFHRLAGNPIFRTAGHGHAFLTTLAEQAGAAGRRDDAAAVVKELDGPLAGDKSLSGAIVLALLSNCAGRVAGADSGVRRRSFAAGTRRAAGGGTSDCCRCVAAH